MAYRTPQTKGGRIHLFISPSYFLSRSRTLKLAIVLSILLMYSPSYRRTLILLMFSDPVNHLVRINLMLTYCL